MPFRTLGAAEVIVAEGPGHRRDNEYLLSAWDFTTLYASIRFVTSISTPNVRATPMRSSFTNFKQLYLPETLFNADLLVSMPKLKTHHWAGVTLSMKNLFGIIPGTI